MTTPLSATHNLRPASRGIHHLALNTDDMKATVDFYTRVLGMPLVHALRVPPGVGVGPGNRGNPPFENLRHYFFDAGGDTLVAFFEMPKGAKSVGDRDALAAMQHCSFTTSKKQFDVLHQRLKDEGVALIGPVNVGAQTWSLYFFDPNGIRLELSGPRGVEYLERRCPVVVSGHGPFAHCQSQLRATHDPIHSHSWPAPFCLSLS